MVRNITRIFSICLTVFIIFSVPLTAGEYDFEKIDYPFNSPGSILKWRNGVLYLYYNYSTDDGKTWNELDIPEDRSINFYKYFITENNELIYAGEFNKIKNGYKPIHGFFMTDDFGKTWKTLMEYGTDVNSPAVFEDIGDGEILVAPKSKLIKINLNTLTIDSMAKEYYVRGLDYYKEGNLLVAFFKDGFYISKDRAVTWQKIASFGTPPLTEAPWHPFFNGRGDIFMIQSRNSNNIDYFDYYRTGDLGKTWAKIDIPGDNTSIDITYTQALPYKNLFFLCTALGLFVSEDYGDTWYKAKLPAQDNPAVYSIAITDKEELYIATEEYILKGKLDALDVENAEPAGRGISLYPNPLPAGSELNITIETEKPGSITFAIYDVLGALAEKPYKRFFDRGKFTIQYKPDSGLAPGKYWLRAVLTDGSYVVRPFVVE